ncbi:MAG: hypothetical protein H7061_08175 [Bdellovibrionaceae bacterium]|nr:hypothetical protein [Bdellovibrio sp.]
MKTFPKQTSKWILSTLLFAALGSQYYYSVSSNNVYSVEMSSLNKPAAKPAKELTAQEALDKIEKDQTCTTCETAATAQASNLSAIKTVAAVSGTNSAAPTATNTDCKSKPTFEERRTCTEQEVKDYEAQQNDCSYKVTIEERKKCIEQAQKTVAKTVKKEKVDILDKDCDSITDRTERRECAKEQKEAIAEAELKEHTADFKERADALGEKCAKKKEGNTQCLTTGLANLLKKFDKKKIDAAEVTTFFNENIESDLRAAISNIQMQEDRIANSEKAMGIPYGTSSERIQLNEDKAKVLLNVKNLSEKVPSAYNALPNRMMDVIKSVYQSAATNVNNNFKLAKSFDEAKKPWEAQEARNHGIAGKEALTSMNHMYANELKADLQSSETQIAKNYYTTNFMPRLDGILKEISSLTNFDNALVGASNSDRSSVSNSTNGRPARNGTTTGTNEISSLTPGPTPNNGNTRFIVNQGPPTIVRPGTPYTAQ